MERLFGMMQPLLFLMPYPRRFSVREDNVLLPSRNHKVLTCRQSALIISGNIHRTLENYISNKLSTT